MRVLWLCNIMLPIVAKELKKTASNKEGWLSGLSDAILQRREENGIELGVAFPVEESSLPDGYGICRRVIESGGSTLTCFGFYEDVTTPELYDPGLETRLKTIVDAFKPDMVHCFGTEYPHTLAMCKVFPNKDKILVSIQGLCSVYANAYYANLPQKVIQSKTLRDWLKKDSIVQQQEKYVLRGELEKQAIKIAKNIAGRTEWDRFYAKEWNPDVKYYNMNETLRSNFYDGSWSLDRCRKHSIFVSQGDYPIKGLHYMILALPEILEKYPDTVVCVAGGNIIKEDTFVEQLKISAYGKYLRKLISKHHLEKHILFLGKLTAEQMKERYLKSHLYVCCSTIENSPNSLGEAMMLGVPCVSANVGGIPSLFQDHEDGILYEGFKTKKNRFDNTKNDKFDSEAFLETYAKRLSKAVLEMWSDEEAMLQYSRNAKRHARRNHDSDRNYDKMKDIYAEIIAGKVGKSQDEQG